MQSNDENKEKYQLSYQFISWSNGKFSELTSLELYGRTVKQYGEFTGILGVKRLIKINLNA